MKLTLRLKVKAVKLEIAQQGKEKVMVMEKVYDLQMRSYYQRSMQIQEQDDSSRLMDLADSRDL